MIVRGAVLVLLVALFTCVSVRAPASGPGSAPAVADQVSPAEISDWLTDASRPLPADNEAQRPMLLAVYRERSFRPIWLDEPALQDQLLAAVDRSAGQGIDPQELGAERLKSARSDPAMTPAGKDILFSQTFLSYAAMLQAGRIDIADLESDWALPRPVAEPAAVLGRLSASGNVQALLEDLAPSSPDYRGLLDALAGYRRMQAAGGWPGLATGMTLHPGDQGPRVGQLRVRLAAEGYLPPGAVGGDSFDPTLEDALRRFQARHGLAVDGRLGAATTAALNVNVAERIRQIALNLERARAVAHDWPATRIMVNTAAESLAFYRDGRLVLESPAIVGDPRHPTPALAATVAAVLFNPAWDIPASIIRNEIQPRLAGDPGYLVRNHMQILGRAGGDPYGRDVDWRHTSILASGWRLRQLPGAWNSLGSVLLEMPNPFDVYIHDTPARGLFSQAYRALSHGCVRVQQIRPLAGALLGSAWPGDAVDRAIAGGVTVRVPLASPVPVYLIYATAFVDRQGAVEFRDDIYGRDARLAAALARLAAAGNAYTAALAPPPRACPSG